MPFALQLLKDWQGLGISSTRMLLECQITEDFDWEQAGVDTSKLDEDELSFQMQSWKAFVVEKVPL